jgi:formyltetrahydrofolate deformylase
LSDTAILLVDCPDRKGLVAAVANLLYAHGANITHADQHQDHDAGLFFMRVEWALDDFDLGAFRAEFASVAEGLGMRWRIEQSSIKPKVVILVSRQLHCLADLLHRHQSGELRCEIPLVASNHEDGRSLAEFYGIRYERVTEETRLTAMLSEIGADLIILARYMQILSPELVSQYPNAIINVHHSFLPAFVGAKPYHAAFARGVKLIGSTSHYVTEVLDDGPIIEQDVTRISHRDQVPDLIEKGRDLERIVLSRAVRWRLEHRILSYGNKTVVFD